MSEQKLPGYGTFGNSGPFGTNLICDQCDKWQKITRERAYKECVNCGLWCYTCHQDYHNPVNINTNDHIEDDALLCGQCISDGVIPNIAYLKKKKRKRELKFLISESEYNVKLYEDKLLIERLQQTALREELQMLG
jgi:uncharacterized CHY-type Zn-finger protein